MNCADFPPSLRPSAWASPGSLCRAGGTGGSRGLHPDWTARQKEMGGNGRTRRGDTKEMLCSRRDERMQVMGKGKCWREMTGTEAEASYKQYIILRCHE